MTNQQKNIAFWLGSILGVVLILFLLVLTNHQLNSATTSNTVTFSGSGKVLAKPDIAKFRFSIMTQAVDSKAAQDANAAKSKEVAAVLKKLNIDEKDIRTMGYNIYPQQTYSNNGGPRVTGYQVTQAYEVKIHDLENANDVVDGVVDAGVNQVEQLQFDIDNPDALKAQAREQAISNAKQKASELESQIGIHLGKIVNFQEDIGGYPGPVYYDKVMTSGGMGGGGAPEISTGENEVSVSVTITYQIK